MRKHLLAVLIPVLFLFGCGIASQSETVGTHLWKSLTGSCGVQRWEVKTLTDDHAGDVALTPIYNARIDGLITRPAPLDLIQGFTSPRDQDGKAPWELHVFRLTGKIEYAKHEADQDVHMGIVAPSGAHMIVESTFPGCAQGSRVLGQISAVRSWVDANFNSLVGKTVTVTGVGFTDFVHGQTLVAPNGIELHPLLSISPTAPAPAPALRFSSKPEHD